MSNKYQPKVELMALDKIKPYDKNAKIHTESQVQSLVKVIQSQGWDVPIVVDKDGVIIKGHGRRLAALSMGLKEVPVIVRRDMSEAEVKAARLSDNRVAMGDFDVDAIKDELEALKSGGFDLNNMGFDEKEVKMMLGELDNLNFDAFEPDTLTTSNESKPIETDSDAGDMTAPEDKPKVKAVLLADLLGFKHIPGEFKDDLVAFQAKAEEASGKTGAEAFCDLIQRLMQGMTNED